MQSAMVASFFYPSKNQSMDELPFCKGDFVRVDGINAVVVGNEEDEYIPHDHIAVFFGSGLAKRESEGGDGNGNPEVWIVPLDVCEDGLEPEYREE
jgi:hypothetical protein